MITMNCMFCRADLVYDIQIATSVGTMGSAVAQFWHEVYQLQQTHGANSVAVTHAYCRYCRIMYRPPES